MKVRRSDTDIMLERLLQANYGLLVSQAKKFANTQDELDDYIQIAALSAIKAIKTYNSERGSLTTHICNCIRNAILNHIQKQKRSNFTVSSNKFPVSQASENVSHYFPDNLDDTDTTIIEMKLANYTRKEIAEALGCKENQVRWLIQKTFQKIRSANPNEN